MGRSRLLPWALALSLALNVFTVAFGATLYARGSAPRLLDPVPIEAGYRVAGLLGEPAASDLRRSLDAARPQIDAHLARYRTLLASGAALLDAPEVDRAALGALIAEARSLRTAIGDLLTDLFVEAVVAMPPGDRRALIQRLRLQPERGN